MFKDISIYIKTCIACQQNKLPDRRLHKDYLIPIPCRSIFDRISLDIMGPLPRDSNGNTHVLGIIDSFSKWPELYPMKGTTAKETAELFYHQFICRFGAPTSILTDRGMSFMGKLNFELCRLFQINKMTSSSFCPTGNGMIERLFRKVKSQLRTFCNTDQTSWASKLQPICYSLRASVHASTGYSPYFVNFGISMRVPFDEYSIRLKTNHKGAQFLSQVHNDLQTIRREVKDNIILAQHTYKHQHDKTITRPPHKYILGEKIWLFVPYIHKTKHHKLTPQWTGPKYISRIHDNGTYHVRNCIDDRETGPINHRRLTTFQDPNLRPREYITKHFPIIHENLEENHEM
jgi:hypothetical protein